MNSKSPFVIAMVAMFVATVVVVSAVSAGPGWFKRAKTYCENCQRHEAPAQPAKRVEANLSAVNIGQLVPNIAAMAAADFAESNSRNKPAAAPLRVDDTETVSPGVPAILNVPKQAPERTKTAVATVRKSAAEYVRSYRPSPYNGKGCVCAPPAPRRHSLFGWR